MTENLIKFPSKSSQTIPSTQEESFQYLQSVRTEFCDEVTSDVLDAVTAVLSSYGFIIKNEHAHIKDIIFLEETIKALTYRFKKLSHPLHEIIESSISVQGEDPVVEDKIDDKKAEKKLNN